MRRILSWDGSQSPTGMETSSENMKFARSFYRNFTEVRVRDTYTLRNLEDSLRQVPC